MEPDGDKRRVDFVLLISTFAVALLILGAVTGLFLEGLGGLYQGHADYQKNAQAQRDAASEIIAKTCVRIDGTVIPECLTKEIGTYYQQQATNQDLKAQQDMAYWAMWLLILGVGQVGISGFGIYFIWDSLRLNRVMAKAAIDANAVTREIGKAEVRAYLRVSDVSIEVSQTSTIYAKIVVSNSGQSPAHNAKLTVGLKMRAIFQANRETMPEHASGEIDSQGEFSVGSISAQGTGVAEPWWDRRQLESFDFKREFLDSFFANFFSDVTGNYRLHLTIVGTVTWTDVFNCPCTLNFHSFFSEFETAESNARRGIGETASLHQTLSEHHKVET